MRDCPRPLNPTMAMRMSPFAPSAAARTRAGSERAAEAAREVWRNDRRFNLFIMGRSGILFGGGVGGEAFRGFGLDGIAFVENETIFESGALPSGDLEVAGASGLRFIHVMFAERIGCEKAVIP